MNPKSRFFKVLKSVGQLPFVRDIEDKINSGARSISVKTLTGSLGAVIIAAISRKFDRPILYIAPNKETAENVCYDLSLFINSSELALMTEPENSVHFDSGQADDRMMWLVDGLSHFADGENIIAVATPDIFEIDLPGASQIEEHKTVIETGQNLNFVNFTQGLALNGFEKKEFVGVQGDMAVRGGILDIWPIGWENPLRVEFWGDE
ncbi:MAG: hypothetical protein PF588_03220, partial [Candidatus Kapabacteria bacterium]|nr:hypothetical protein [Candidatus Kapabacteria bacterium]